MHTSCSIWNDKIFNILKVVVNHKKKMREILDLKPSAHWKFVFEFKSFEHIFFWNFLDFPLVLMNLCCICSQFENEIMSYIPSGSNIPRPTAAPDLSCQDSPQGSPGKQQHTVHVSDDDDDDDDDGGCQYVECSEHSREESHTDMVTDMEGDMFGEGHVWNDHDDRFGIMVTDMELQWWQI